MFNFYYALDYYWMLTMSVVIVSSAWLLCKPHFRDNNFCTAFAWLSLAYGFAQILFIGVTMVFTRSRGSKFVMTYLEYVEIGVGTAFGLKMVLFLLMYLVASMEFFWTSFSIPIIQVVDGQYFMRPRSDQDMAGIQKRRKISTIAGSALILILGIALGLNDFFLRFQNYPQTMLRVFVALLLFVVLIILVCSALIFVAVWRIHSQLKIFPQQQLRESLLCCTALSSGFVALCWAQYAVNTFLASQSNSMMQYQKLNMYLASAYLSATSQLCFILVLLALCYSLSKQVDQSSSNQPAVEDSVIVS